MKLATWWLIALLAAAGCSSEDDDGANGAATPAQGGSAAGTSAAPAGGPQAVAPGAAAAMGQDGSRAGSTAPGAEPASPGGEPEPTGGGDSGAQPPDGPAAEPETISLAIEPDREHLYDDADKWLCLPGEQDELCTTDLDATIVRADGTTEVEPHVVASDPAFDCFYVYPTVSNDPGVSSDWTANMEETNVVRVQAARYTRVCRLFAPLYRQVTLTALNGGGITDEARATAYEDVRAAFNRYLTAYNQGRGFVLIGHSQGSGVLRKLIVGEIDERPELRARLIAAHLMGTSLPVPEGADVGGELKNVPVCRGDDQFGCVVAYATFRDRSPPPSDSRFGKVASGRAACANPGALGGGKAVLTPYFGNNQPAFADGMRVSTPFVTFPDFIQTECVDQGEFTYLQLTVLGDPSDPRVDDINGDLTPDWGMHLVDVHIAMGTLVDLAAEQAQAFLAQP